MTKPNGTIRSQSNPDYDAGYKEGFAAGIKHAQEFIEKSTTPSVVIAVSPSPVTHDVVVEAITDMQKGRDSHIQWAEHLRDATREDCQGCTDHAAHIGDAAYHEKWIEKYDRVIKLLALVPYEYRFADSEEDLVDEVQRRMDAVVDAAVEAHCADEDWIEKEEVLDAAIESLLELRDKPTEQNLNKPSLPQL